ncbi:hypothetical protein JRQ81_004268 [Phrynocephalus forsythii]|uniref:Ribonuclease A-domain domain-containing protein n=1 Tax=Phrynocephalus forsythii TaxID=171643 RepID=A0A9Q0XEV7_9SAUR|nr:hypothetical protein JRQ81_004268 [Phrynocephalus forsythii]
MHQAMVSKSSYQAWFFLVFTWMVASVEAAADYETFLIENVDFPRTQARNDDVYCRLIMSKRCFGYRVVHNYIVHAPEDQLRAICTVNNQTVSGYRKNTTPLPVTNCYDANGDLAFTGDYLTGIFEVRCKDGFPIEFNGFRRYIPIKG